MGGVRLLHLAGELYEAETGADTADRRPTEKQPADEGHIPQQREHDQQLKEHVDFLDLRPARRRIARERDGDQRSQKKQPQRQFDGRQTQLFSGQEQRRQGQAQEDLGGRDAEDDSHGGREGEPA